MPSNEPSDRIYRFGEGRLIASDRILLGDAEHVPLASRVRNLLAILVENAGRLATKKTLMNQIWR
jgi:DNA-binding winged helix-turn-helix (wHTH) protein